MQANQPPEQTPTQPTLKAKWRKKTKPLEAVRDEAERLEADIAELEGTLNNKRRDLQKCQEAKQILEAQ
jgi:chromosome segregation ATPase